MSKKIVGKAGTLNISQAGNMSLVTMDIETLFDKRLGGFKQGEMVILASTPTGKSMFWANEIYNKNLCKEIMLPTKPQSKYKFSRAKWYSVELKGQSTWRFSDEYNQIIEWCTKHFGPHPAKADAWSRWHVGLGMIHFRDSKDYEWYMLRWS